MIDVLILQLSVTIIVILSIALVVNQLLEISLNKSFIISICLIILLSMLLYKLSLHKNQRYHFRAKITNRRIYIIIVNPFFLVL